MIRSQTAPALKHTCTYAAFFLGALVANGVAQTDALVAKGLGHVISDGSYLWGFADSGTSYSRIDLFQDPPQIWSHTGTLPGIDGGKGRSRSVLLHFHYSLSDTSTQAGLLSLDRKDAIQADTVVFRHKKSALTTATSVQSFTDMVIHHDTVYVAANTAGFAALPLNSETGGQRYLADSALHFKTFVRGQDTVQTTLDCKLSQGDKNFCETDTLDIFRKLKGLPEPIFALAIDSIAPDTIHLWLGTLHGLWKLRLGSTEVTHVSWPGVADSLEVKVTRIVTDSRSGRIWAFSTGRFAVSLNHGEDFHIPPARSGLSNPKNLQGFNATPEAIMVGDTTWINFNLDKPGLVLFAGDSVLRNAVAKDDSADPGDILFDATDSLNLIPGEGRFTAFAQVALGSKRIVALGSTAKGLFYLPLNGGQAWKNINRQKEVKSGLTEIITYPSYFTAARPDGHPDYVHIGYRLKKESQVTITIYNYAMEKVREIVRKAPRKGGGGRSENALEDRWDGLDSQGRSVSVGTYYVRVESSNGEGGWGKILALAGRQ